MRGDAIVLVLKRAMSPKMEEHVLLKLFSCSDAESSALEKLVGMSKAVFNLTAEDELKILDLVVGCGLQIKQGNNVLKILLTSLMFNHELKLDLDLKLRHTLNVHSHSLLTPSPQPLHTYTLSPLFPSRPYTFFYKKLNNYFHINLNKKTNEVINQ